jgi:protein-S-isoprenylcysteine O-methyltransferase Ste14
MWQWRPIPAVVWGVDNGSAHKLVIGVAVAGWVLAVLAYYSIGHLELLGLRHAWRHFRGDRPHPGELVTTGVYRYLRDPMYLGFAVGMWSTPIMTAGHLLLSTGMSLYLLIGLHYERRDLVARFGDRYLTYLRTGS